MKNKIEVTGLTVTFDFETIKTEHPVFLMSHDAITQYFGLWKIIWMYVSNLNATKVLEFGTREGYSTQLFSQLLRANNGHLHTVDLANHKIPQEIVEKMDNVTLIKQDVLQFKTDEFYDILYIDDWHNPYHLFQELDRFAKYAKVILIHDVVQNWQTHEWLMPAIFSWCLKEHLAFMTYPLNACGLVAIHREEYQNFYKV